MRCKITRDECIACGLCQVIEPKLFDYDENGIVLFLSHPDDTLLVLSKERQEGCIAAVKKCPTRAISILDL